MSKLELETHKYDGIIGQLYHQLILNENDNLLSLNDNLPSFNDNLPSFNDSVMLIERWITQTKIKDKKHIINTINLIKNDHVGNYDSINDIHVEELLPRVINIVRYFDPSGIDLFLQNFGEISELGSCPQGRTTRLLSFYISFKT